MINNAISSQLNVFNLENHSYSDDKEKKIKQVAGNFSSFFINELLESARHSSFNKEGLFNSEATKTSQKLFNQQIALQLGNKDSFGIAKLIEKELNYQGHNHEKS